MAASMIGVRQITTMPLWGGIQALNLGAFAAHLTDLALQRAKDILEALRGRRGIHARALRQFICQTRSFQVAWFNARALLEHLAQRSAVWAGLLA